MDYGCIGEKLGHSFSREIHARIAPYRYELKEMPPEAVGAFMQARDFRAVNVTIPYKTAVIPYLDEISPRAAAIGAVNTIVRHGDKLTGYNTDYDGMAYLLDSLGIDVRGREVLILGTGGTSLTATALMRDRDAKEVLRVSRTAAHGAIDYACAYRDHAGAEVIINTTPVGMYPNCDGVPIDITRFPRLCGVLDAVYNPLRTRLVTAARAAGIPADGGLAMLVAQAVRASELFTGTTLPADITAAIARDVLREKEHICLIGMPGCGKTSVGTRLAALTGRECIDLDRAIVRAAGCDIPTIFAERGEAYFRDLESRVLRETVFSATGKIICTGGGAPLRAENTEALRQTGRIIWIDRPLSALCPTADRPTAFDAAAMAARYRERYEIYRAAADCRIDGDGTVEAVTARIMEELKQ